MADSPTPDNNLVLRQLTGMRRDMAELMEREARSIELMNRLALRIDAGFAQTRESHARLDARITDMQGDLVLMENRILTAIAEVRALARRIDDPEHA